MQSSQFISMGSSGCLLPFLIIFNLFFGKPIFGSTRLWLGVEALLILIFILRINIMTRKAGQNYKPKGRIIDVEGHVVEDKKKLK